MAGAGRSRAKKPKEETKPWQVVSLLLGLLAVALGCWALYKGLGPLGAFWDLMGPMFSGGQPSEQQLEEIEDIGPALKARIPWDVAGAVLLVAGTVAIKLALKGPKPKTVEEQVEEAVNARLAELGVRAAPQALGLAAAGSAGAPAAASSHAGQGPALALAPAPPAAVASAPTALAGRSNPLPAAGAPRCPTCQSLLVAGRFCRDGHV